MSREEEISLAGHRCAALADAIQREVARLNREPATQAMLLGVTAPTVGIDWAGVDTALSVADKLLKKDPSVTFEMSAEPHSLASWRENLIAARALAEPYRKSSCPR